MKNKIMAMLVAFGLVGSVSAIEVNENLSINGFIDSSWSSTDEGNANDEVNLGVDEIELNFLFSAGGVSGEVAIDDDDAAGNGLNIEQAHLSYGFEGGISLTLGRMNTVLGLEQEDAGGIFGTQRLYQNTNNNLADIDSNGAQEGLRVGFSAEQFTVSLSAFNDVGIDEETATAPAGEDDLDFELAIAFTGLENITLGGGFQSINGTNRGGVTPDTDVATLNATYTAGKLLLGAEWTSIDTSGLTDDSAWGVVADYDISDVLGISVRYSDEDDADTTAAGAQEGDRLSIAPSYAITESLGAILEYSSSNVNNTDSDTVSLEMTFTF
jgi:hypothetical protein